ncbi:MAG: transposase [Acidobacteriia bacterium]|nr:transposase [Terriglobia bacterium]
MRAPEGETPSGDSTRQASTDGIESFWAVLKRAHAGTFHKLSPKHLDRYVREFAGHHNICESGTLDQMRHTVARLMGRNLLYRDLIADNSLRLWGAVLAAAARLSLASLGLPRQGHAWDRAWVSCTSLYALTN